jgi:hypothetical protein
MAIQNVLDRFPTATGTISDLKRAIEEAANAGSVTATRLQEDLRGVLGALPSGAAAPSVAEELRDRATLLKDPEFSDVKRRLEDLASQILQDPAAYDVKRIQDELGAVIRTIPYLGAVADAIKKDLNDLMQQVGQTGYTVRDAKRDVQAFVDGMGDRYMRDVIAQLNDAPALQKTLRVLLDDAEHDMEKFKENIEVWFNNAMDRVGGWYKRKTQWVIGLVAIILTVMLNVDALSILQQLNTQPGIRDSLVAQAKALADRPPGILQQAAASIGQGSGQAISVAGTGSSSSRISEGGDEVSLETEYRTVRDQLNQLSLPIGWFALPAADKPAWTTETKKFRDENYLILPKTCFWNCETDWRLWERTVAFHWLGWLLTALAASLGAPFWFDMLNKVMSIRAAGKAPEERPKSPKEVPTPLEPGQSPAEADRINTAKRR